MLRQLLTKRVPSLVKCRGAIVAISVIISATAILVVIICGICCLNLVGVSFLILYRLLLIPVLLIVTYCGVFEGTDNP